MSAQLAATVAYAVAGWLTYLLIVVTHEKLDTPWRTSHAVAAVVLAVLWPLTVVIVAVGGIIVAFRR